MAGFDQHATKVTVARSADTFLIVSVATTHVDRSETAVAAKLLAIAETMEVADFGEQNRGGDQADAFCASKRELPGASVTATFNRFST